MAKQHTSIHRPTARVGWNGRAQTVTIPDDFRFPASVHEVFIRREGESIVLMPRPPDWSGFFTSGMAASADFMEQRERMSIQERTSVGDVCGPHPVPSHSVDVRAGG